MVYAVVVWVCIECGRRFEGNAAPSRCPICRSTALARVNKKDQILAFSSGTGIRCGGCGESGKELSFREFRWILALIVFDLIHSRPGYLCAQCRRRWFFKYQGLTLLLGWWGFLALLIHNPYAIVKNFKALFGTPLFPESSGALNLRDIRKVESEAPRSPAATVPSSP